MTDGFFLAIQGVAFLGTDDFEDSGDAESLIINVPVPE